MPGVIVKLINAIAGRSSPTNTGRWFVVQQCERGSITAAHVITSMADFAKFLGARVAYSVMWDAAEAFFEEGGNEIIFGRVVGPTPVSAVIELQKAGKKVLVVDANGPGAWGNDLEVQTTAGVAEGTYRLKILEDAVLLEESTDLTTQLDAVTWAAKASNNVVITVGADAGQPEVHAAQELATGDDDLSKVTVEEWADALELFSPELGCGNVSAPGITSSEIQEAVEAHAEATNRSAIIDLTDSGVKATLIAAAASLRAVTGARRSATYAPWALIPGLAAEAPRTVPYSAIQAGILALNDASKSPPPVGEASAGDFGQPRYAIGLSQAGWTRAEREELNEGSVNVVRVMPDGTIETYGNRTLVVPTVEPAWEEFSAARLYMYIWAAGEALMGTTVFKNIDPKNILFSKVEGKLKGFLASLGDALWSYSVNTGSTVNTPATIAKKEVRAGVEVKASETAETVTLNLSVGA